MKLMMACPGVFSTCIGDCVDCKPSGAAAAIPFHTCHVGGAMRKLHEEIGQGTVHLKACG